MEVGDRMASVYKVIFLKEFSQKIIVLKIQF